MASFSHFLIPIFPLALFLIFLYKWQSCNNHHAKKRLPPSPKKLPVIGNLHQVGPSPHRSLQSLSTKHGPLMLLRFGRVPVLVVSSADAAREIMKNQDTIFSNRPKLTIPNKIFYGSKDVVFAPYGDYWRKMRGICVNQLMSPKRVQSFRSVREQETCLMVENIGRLSDSNSVVNLSDTLALLANDVLCRVALGRKYSNSDKGKEFKNMLTEEVEMLGTFCVGDYIPWLAWIDRVSGLNGRVEKLAKWFDRFLESVLEEHRCIDVGGTSKDFVDILLEIQQENEKDGSSTIGDDAIKAILLNMFADGTDTTYSVMEWTMAELLKHPNTMAKLQKEVREAAGNKEEITEDDLEKLHYLKAVFKESLRLHVPVPLLVTRESTQDAKVMGYDVTAGTQVIVNAWSIGRDPLLWKNPEDFNPERFLDNNIDFRGMHFELIPFGAGRRGCPGIAYATVLNELAIAKLVHKFNFDLPDQAKKNDLDVSESAGITAHLKFPLHVVATHYT
ncbi:hypothetical protein ABFX02_11G087400 [Erythranthe guttata]